MMEFEETNLPEDNRPEDNSLLRVLKHALLCGVIGVFLFVLWQTAFSREFELSDMGGAFLTAVIFGGLHFISSELDIL